MSIIAVPTATRAEYGNLRPFIQELRDNGFEVRIIATGAHLSQAYGETYQEIEEDGFAIDYQIPILVDSDNACGVSKTMALAISGFADYFANRRPDGLLVLGDRYEMLAIACAAFNERIPIFHLYGGETTEGAIDEAIRHCITKMSYLHFTATEPYRKRVIQLGEDPSRVFTIGNASADNKDVRDILSKKELFASLEIDVSDHYAVMTYHPVTLADGEVQEDINELLAALEKFSNLTFIATKANADAGGRGINEVLEQYAAKHNNFFLFDSLGSKRYLSALAYADAVVGNSSSGITETVLFKVPTVNIGIRQQGRIRGANVIDCAARESDIHDALMHACSDEFRQTIKDMDNPFGGAGAAKKTVAAISSALSRPIKLQKKFYDISFD